MSIGSSTGNLLKSYFKYGAITTVDINSQKVFEQTAFSWSKRFEVAGSSSVDIVLDPTSIPAEKRFVLLPISFQAIGGGPLFIDLYAGTASNEDGILWQGSNRDAESIITPDLTIRLNPTITNPGVKTDLEFLLPGGSAEKKVSIGGETKNDLIYLPLTNVKQMFRIDNQSNDESDCLFSMTVFEVPRNP